MASASKPRRKTETEPTTETAAANDQAASVAVAAEPKIQFPPLSDMKERFGGNKSAIIRYLAAEYGHGKDGVNLTGPISEYLSIRYQHARNVLTTPLKKPSAPGTKAAPKGAVVVDDEDETTPSATRPVVEEDVE